MSDQQSPRQIPVIPDHESAVRRAIADAHNRPYLPLHSLQEAQSYPDGAVIFEGDWGGQIYATCPAALVRCSEAVLDLLLRDFDALGWCDMQGARIFY
jgi:hypothetical protein